jgi:hypothetical protein
VPLWKHIRRNAQPTAFLLAKPAPRNVNLGSVRFSMFNNQRDIPFAVPAKIRGGPGCLNRFSASISGASAEVRLPSGGAAA